MGNKAANYFCRVCGLENETPPWGYDEKSPEYDICECCGVEHGYEDYTIKSTKEYRTKWLASGGKWWESKLMPKNWSLENQLLNIPEEYK